jgi:large repetitive protein
MRPHTLHKPPPTTYRRAWVLAVAVSAAALVVAGCAARTTTPASTPTTVPSASPVSPRPASVAPTDRTESAGATEASEAVPAGARCAVSPATGPAGSRTTLTCSGFAPSEAVAISFLAEVLTTTRATAKGDVTSSFQVPSGFAGAHYPGRKDTFRAEGRQSARSASATFTVTG